MKRSLVLLAMIMCATISRPCGGWEYADSDLFYNLFLQTGISDEQLYPFLKNEYGEFFNYEASERSENLELWQELLPKWDMKKIRSALYASDDTREEPIWKGRLSTQETQIRDYMDYAQRCSKAFAYRSAANSWDYDEIRKKKVVDVSDLVVEGNKAFNAKADKRISLRYGYQIVRLFHYAGRAEEGIKFFEDHIKDRFTKDEIYYYTVDQAGGCYYNLEKYSEAALCYLEVFGESRDRKTSAYRSYCWSLNRGAKIDSILQDKKLEIAHITLMNMGEMDPTLHSIKKVIAIDPQSSKVELLFMRTLNELERKALPKFLWSISDRTSSPHMEESDVRQAQEMIVLAAEMQKKGAKDRKEFWKLSQSYLEFLQGDISQAKKDLDSVSDKQFAAQKETFALIYEVYSWDAMTKAREEFIAPSIAKVLGTYLEDQELDPAALALDRVGHLYLTAGKIAKAFLIHHDPESLTAYSSVPLIDSLLDYSHRRDLSSLDSLLIQRIARGQDMATAHDYLNFCKGKVYLQEADPTHALEAFLLVKSERYAKRDHHTRGIADSVFSNNIVECFNCPVSAVMDDQVFSSDIFDFIPKTMSYTELAQSLIKLEEMTKEGATWKRKLAHYLLGNYYYNMDNTGYYRGSLADQTNCCNYDFFSSSFDSAPFDAKELIMDKQVYNMAQVNLYADQYYEFAPTAVNHYRSVMSLSEDAELNARCLYMIAKCELNLDYNYFDELNDWGGFDGSVERLGDAYLAAFEELHTEYSDTEFYSRIITECSFFRYYCSW